MPRTSVKGQVLADLIAKFVEPPIAIADEGQNIVGKLVGTISVQEPLRWKVYADGAANQRGSGVGLVLISPKKIIIEKSLRLGFSAINIEWTWYQKWGKMWWKCSRTRDWLWAR